MKAIIYYEANDGKRFEDEGECIKYAFAKDFEPIAEMLKIWNGDGQKIPITHRTDLDDAWAIYCSSITAAIFLKEWGEKDKVRTPYTTIDIENGIEVPLGTFIWYNNDWYKVDEVITLFEKMSRQMSDGEEEIFIPMN